MCVCVCVCVCVCGCACNASHGVSSMQSFSTASKSCIDIPVGIDSNLIIFSFC